MYTSDQIAAAKENAKLHGYMPELISDDMAIEFLDWFHSANTEYASVEDAKRAGLSGLVTNGVLQQEAWWKDKLT